jgi:hypothetical protein
MSTAVGVGESVVKVGLGCTVKVSRGVVCGVAVAVGAPGVEESVGPGGGESVRGEVPTAAGVPAGVGVSPPVEALAVRADLSDAGAAPQPARVAALATIVAAPVTMAARNRLRSGIRPISLRGAH